MISSAGNPKIKYVKRLQTDRRFREREGVFIMEGTRWLAELVHFGVQPHLVFFSEEWAKSATHRALLDQLRMPALPVNEPLMALISDTDSPPGILAVVPLQARPLPDRPDFLLILDEVTNPGNLGTILRTAAAAGVNAVLLGPGCVDAYNPKVVRGGMGAHLRLPIKQASWPEIAAITAGVNVWLAAANGRKVYTEIDWRPRSALVIGGEAAGAGAQAAQLAQSQVSIPMVADTESLNAAVATGIILFEAVRQRAIG
jgi:RNA methyltransferase, TrmH family